MDERTRTNVASYTVNEALPVDAFDNGNQGAGVIRSELQANLVFRLLTFWLSGKHNVHRLVGKKQRS